MSNPEPVSDKEKAKYEWRSFLFITIFLFPILAVAIVGGYGFIVWAMQVFSLGSWHADLIARYERQNKAEKDIGRTL